METYLTAGQVAKALGGVVYGDENTKLYNISRPTLSTKDSLTYLETHYNYKDIPSLKFGAILVETVFMLPTDRTYILINQKGATLVDVLVELFHDANCYVYPKCVDYISSSANISKEVAIADSVSIGDGTTIAEYVKIGSNVSIGANCTIKSGVAIAKDTIIGNNVTIESNTSIGNDNLYYCYRNHRWHKVSNYKRIVIHDNVSIGANTNVEKGSIQDTIIGKDTIIGSSVSIAHECSIGEGCLIVSQVGIAGFSVVKDRVCIYGKSGISNYVTVESDSIVLANSLVTKDVPSGTVVSGNPARPHKQTLKRQAFLDRLFKKYKF
jgi:UDP-3-O-[3-hydroxymyristoyl] glucosamine N-acyltransferase